jgi:CRISPR-associated protein Cst2
MSQHIFGAFITPMGVAANNRGETEGNMTTLQKIIWQGQPHTTVSAEAIRFALRRRLEEFELCNRTFDESTRSNDWKDHTFSGWATPDGDTYIDDDILGYMIAEAAAEENAKGTAKVRRAVLEVSRAVSLTPWSGDFTFNAASPGATPSAAKKGKNPVPYGTEVHATCYQYGIALTPERLRKQGRAAHAITSLCSLGPVAGNHGRFLFDFSPESAVFRITQDPAPRLLYCFGTRQGQIHFDQLLHKVSSDDIDPTELVIGGAITATLSDAQRAMLQGAALHSGVRAASQAVCQRLES